MGLALPGLLAAGAVVILAAAAGAQTTVSVGLKNETALARLTAFAGEQTLFVYQYGADLDLPRFFPLNSPSGKNLLVEETEPYPHHRAFWVADTVRVRGVKGDVYNSYYSGKKVKGKRHEGPFDRGARHEDFRFDEKDGAAYGETLVWEAERSSGTIALLREHRRVRVLPMEQGAYLMDFSFELEAAFGDVEFISDAVHYAWPFLRINKAFSGEGGGTLTRDDGTTGQEATNLKAARWIDYSNQVNGVTEGIAMFQYPDGGEPRRWLTRDYGTFGPRRPENQSGIPFILPKGQRLRQRVGIYVHRGDALSGRVEEVYRKYIQLEGNGSLP